MKGNVFSEREMRRFFTVLFKKISGKQGFSFSRLSAREAGGKMESDFSD